MTAAARKVHVFKNKIGSEHCTLCRQIESSSQGLGGCLELNTSTEIIEAVLTEFLWPGASKSVEWDLLDTHFRRVLLRLFLCYTPTEACMGI